MRTLATWCFRHRRLVVAGWVVLVVGLIALSQAAGTKYDNSLSLPKTDSTQALHLLLANAPAQSGDVEQIVIAARGTAHLTDPTVRAQADALFAKLATLPDVSGVLSPFAPGSQAQLSADGKVAFASLTYAKQGDVLTVATGKNLVDTARSFRTSQLDVAVEGAAATKAAEQDLGGVGVGILAALVVLLLVFGSVLAATLPLVATLFALPAATSVIGLLTHVISLSDSAGQLVPLIGLGVGVDYALFIVTRTRQGLQSGQDPQTAIVNAVATSGRAVLFAGGVVCIALFGLMALGIGIMTGLGIAASVGVLFTMATALTLLPALLGFIGPKVFSRKQRRALAGSAAPVDETGMWWRWSALMARRPAVPALVAIAVIGVLSVPLFSLRVGTADDGNQAPANSNRQAYDLLAKGFGPGFNGPLQIAAEVTNSADDLALNRLTHAISADPGVAAVTDVRTLATHGTTRVVGFEVFATTAPQDVSTTELLQRLRTHLVPDALRGSTAHAFVGGGTAIAADFTHVVARRMPLFVGLVVLLSFLLLVVLFRSILIPLTAALMNVLSTVAALGVMSAAYVWGWGGTLLGASRAGPVEAPMIVVIFAILFGLSMDYQVFLATRIQEEWRRTGDTKVAVTRGLAITGRTITAAAVIMVVVFASFILGGERLIKMFGLGLAAAVFVDAFLVRVAIVPAVMLLLGRANWWLPRRLEKLLPHFDIESEPQAPIRELAGVH